jgi:hypothetical protein
MAAHYDSGEVFKRFRRATDAPKWMERHGYQLIGPDTWRRRESVRFRQCWVEGRIQYRTSVEAGSAATFFRHRGIACAVATHDSSVVVVTEGMDEAMMIAGTTITRTLPPFEHAWRFYLSSAEVQP